jgi:rRNA maturation RNase YbeY
VVAKEELIRVVYHGVLHLVGYKDKTEEEKMVMTSKENEYLFNFVSRETKE